MKKVKEFEIPLTNIDTLDVKIKIKNKEVIGFVINYRTKVKNVWYQIYRVDTAHGYLHEQRFWLSPGPINLPRLEGLPLKYIFNFFMEEIKNNFKRYKKYYLERMVLK